MKHFALTALIITLLAACSTPGDRCILRGSIEGVKQAEFYVYCEDGDNEKVDTIRIENGSFTYERPLTAPTVLTLLYPNFTRTYLIAEPGTEIRLEGNAARLGEADIRGSQENELLTEFRLDVAAKKESEARLAAADFIRSHPDRLAAAAVYKRHFADPTEADPSTALSLLTVLRRAQPRNTYITAMAARIETVLTTAKGRKMPAWTAEDLDHRTLSDKDFAGRPYVIAFYAGWNGECTELLHAVSRLSHAYRDRVGIVAVSADYSPHIARQRLRRDSIATIPVCDRRGIASPTARRMGLRFVPGCIIVDRSGRIIDRDVTPGDLERLIEEQL